MGAAAGPTAAELREARKELARIERRLEKLAAEETKLHAQMAEHSTDHEKVGELDVRLRALHDEREQLEAQWLTAAEIAE